MAEGGTEKTWVEPIFQCKMLFPGKLTLSVKYLLREMGEMRERAKEENQVLTGQRILQCLATCFLTEKCP